MAVHTQYTGPGWSTFPAVAVLLRRLFFCLRYEFRSPVVLLVVVANLVYTLFYNFASHDDEFRD